MSLSKTCGITFVISFLYRNRINILLFDLLPLTETFILILIEIFNGVAAVAHASLSFET